MAVLKKGDKFPNFSFQTSAGETLTTGKAIARAGKTVFWVLRYVGCTTCRYDIHVIKERYAEIEALGAQVLVVLQSEPEQVRHDLEGDEAPYDIICDPGQKIYKRFQIRATKDKESRQPKTPEDVRKWEEKIAKVRASGFVHGKYEGDENQLPAMFIVGRDGAVLYAHYAQNSIDMPTFDEVKGLLGAKPAAKVAAKAKNAAAAKPKAAAVVAKPKAVLAPNDTLNCAHCGVINCAHRRGAFPDFCLTAALGQDAIDEATARYVADPADKQLAHVAATVARDYGAISPRVEETLILIQRMGYKKVGIATCVGLMRECSIFARVAKAKGIDVYAVACKVGGVDKSAIGIPEEEKGRPFEYEAICNPILQAEALNRANTDFNLIIGLCVGHDTLFIKHSMAPVTYLIVKDRVLCHNPAAALYTTEGSYRRLLAPGFPAPGNYHRPTNTVPDAIVEPKVATKVTKATKAKRAAKT